MHVVDCLRIGGTERQLAELIRRQLGKDYQIAVSSLQKRGDMLDVFRNMGVEPKEYQPGSSLFSMETGRKILEMAKDFKADGVDIIHTHDFYSGVVGILAAKVAGIPSINSRRDLCHWLGNRQRKVLSFIGRVSTAVVANSAAALGVAVRDDGISRRKSVIIHNGIDLVSFDVAAGAEPVQPFPNSGTEKLICLVGNMQNRVKGHDLFLQAGALLVKKGMGKIRLVLVGDGVLRPEYEQMARDLGIGEKVSFLGLRQDVPSILGRVHVVVLASHAEGMPNVVLEAMAASRPVVSTAVGGATELVTEGVNGYLVPPGDAGLIAERLERILKDDLLAERMGAKGRMLAQSLFNAERMADRFHLLYRAILDRLGERAGLSLEERMRLMEYGVDANG